MATRQLYPINRLDESLPRTRAPLSRTEGSHNSAYAGVAKDEPAVRAASPSPWSNGQTEGQVTKLTLVKRQMYGRAKIDLLQARLIGAT